MYQIPEYYPAVSLRLIEALDEIGVNMQMVLKRRNSYLRREIMYNFHFRGRLSCYYFGSQSEGTTTPGMKSDMDMLYCLNDYNVIQDLSEWRQGKFNLLMIQDEATVPGYCMLQFLRPDVPLPSEDLLQNYFTFDTFDRVLMENTFMHNIGNTNIPVVKGPSVVIQDSINTRGDRHGPAQTLVREGFKDKDSVSAFRCTIWRHAEHPNAGHRQRLWPPHSLSHMTECFLVPVGHRQSENEYIEWRISPSIQERQLMFSMNISQIRCYILLKMIVKHYINPYKPDCISSFHCKTTLFWCTEITSNDFWRSDNLLTCVMFCLCKLLHWIEIDNCPQFLIPQENLFSGKINAGNKRSLIRIVKDIIMSNGRFLFDLPFDDIGQILLLKYNMSLERVINVEPSYMLCLRTAQDLATNECIVISGTLKNILIEMTTSSDDAMTHIHRLLTVVYMSTSRLQDQDNLQQHATNQLIRFLYTTLGSLISSISLCQGNGIPQQALSWFTCGLDSDVASSRLKLASVLYCSGDLFNTDIVLQDIEQRYDTEYIQSTCRCNKHDDFNKTKFARKIFSNEQYTRYTAFCVRFLRSEMFCVPPALRYEMFRSAGDDVLHRDEQEDGWMDWAVVDSLPYLYYLQSMTYRRMGRREDQYRALNNLKRSINHENSLGHRDTACNLLGTCLELEDRVQDALSCYRSSLQIRPRNNAANGHIFRLLFQHGNA